MFLNSTSFDKRQVYCLNCSGFVEKNGLNISFLGFLVDAPPPVSGGGFWAGGSRMSSDINLSSRSMELAYSENIDQDFVNTELSKFIELEILGLQIHSQLGCLALRTVSIKCLQATLICLIFMGRLNGYTHHIW